MLTKTKLADSLITLSDVGLDFDHRPILHDISLEIRPGEIVAIVGRSGSGKTTLIRALAGLLPLSRGVRTFADELRISMVFQEPTLLPWLTVEENIRLPGRLGGFAINVEDLLKRLYLTDCRHLKPRQLSGGMQQRVALARALANRPNVLLMDEPYRSLDEITRELLYEDVLRLSTHGNLAVLLVTHSLTEACYLAQSICVISGSPAKITDRHETTGDPAGERIVINRIRERLRKDIMSLQ